MSKLDLKKKLKEFYRASSKKPKVVDISEGKFLAIIGRGEPGGPSLYNCLKRALLRCLRFKIHV